MSRIRPREEEEEEGQPGSQSPSQASKAAAAVVVIDDDDDDDDRNSDTNNNNNNNQNTAVAATPPAPAATAAPGPVPAAPGPAPAAGGPRQSIETRPDGSKIVKNSPYGAQRAALGWGTPFSKPLVAHNLAAFPGLFIGLSSLNAVMSKKRDMPTLMQQLFTSNKFLAMEHCNPYHNQGTPDTWQSWRDLVLKKPNFYLTVKANQFLTHAKMLENCDDVREHINNFFVTRCSILGDRLGAVLVQMPQQFGYSADNVARVRWVAGLIPPTVKIAFEPRNRAWHNDATYALLREIGWSLVVTRQPSAINGGGAVDSPVVDTGNGLLYMRLHSAATEGIDMYEGDLGPLLVARYAAVIRRFFADNAHNANAKAFVFLNNNESHANGGLTSSVVDATALGQEIIKGGAVTAAEGTPGGAPAAAGGGAAAAAAAP